MSNKLKKIFSDEKVSFVGKINFKNKEAYKQFLVALETVQEEGKAVQVKGIDSVKTLVQNGETVYPIVENDNICDFIVAPSTDEVCFEVETDYGEKEFVLKRYQINKGIVLQTDENSIIFLKFFF